LPETWILNGKVVILPDDWRGNSKTNRAIIEEEFEEGFGIDSDMPWLEKLSPNASVQQILQVMEREDPDLFSITIVPKGIHLKGRNDLAPEVKE